MSFRETDDDGETAASREAPLGEDVEDDEAQLLVQAIGEWQCVAPASRRQSLNTARPWLGFRLVGKTERARGGKPGAQVEGLVLDLIRTQQRPGWTETACAGGGATHAVATARGRG